MTDEEQNFSLITPAEASVHYSLYDLPLAVLWLAWLAY